MRPIPLLLAGITLIATLVIPPLASANVTTGKPTGIFGAVEAFRSGELASAAGMSWQRVSFLQAGLQPDGPDQWNQFYFPDDLIASEHAAGRQIVGLLMGPPAWANGTGKHSDPPHNFALAPDDPNNLWTQYVTKVVSTYKGRIDTWIIWNEPDIWDPNFSIYAFNGNDTDYYRLVKRAYIAAKAANPNATIALGGQTYWWDKRYNRELFFKRYLDIAKADETAAANGFYFDAVVLHLYNDPTTLYDIPVYYKQLMAAYGVDKPVWINETNAVPHDDDQSPLPRSDYRVSLAEQASYAIQAAANALAAGVTRIGFYKMQDDAGYGPSAEPYGLVRADGQPKPVYHAVKTAAKYLEHAGAATRTVENGIVKVTFNKPGSRTTVLWNMTASPAVATVAATAGGATLVDKGGAGQQVGPSGGVYTIQIPPATANTVPGDPSTYLVGGSPVILVENSAQVALQSVEPMRGLVSLVR